MRSQPHLLIVGLLCWGCRSPEREAPQPESEPPAEVRAGLATKVERAVEPRAPEPEPAVVCPVSEEQAGDTDLLLDRAGVSYDAGELEVALACAEVAVDLFPESVEAHHIRAAALASLGRHDQAQVGFAMALAIDPDDPETLAAAAHFYINMLPPDRRAIQVGYEYASRGSSRARSRRRKDRPLRAQLALLEAEALNDLGRSDAALPLIDEALELVPELPEATFERGVVLFNLCRFDEAQTTFSAVLRQAPDDAYAHHYLGLVYERTGRPADADAHFVRARQLARREFGEPVALPAAEFRAEVDAAIAELPADSHELVSKVALLVEELPDIDDLTAVEPPFAPTILGLFRGSPIGEEADADSLPRTIVLYRKNLLRAVRSRDELDQQIRRTLLHEIGHLRGLDEDQLRRLGLD